jgi:predicted nucleotidyltransferase
MNAAFALGDDEAAIVRRVLAAHLPKGAQAFIFGSRAVGGAGPYSDLDLALAGDRPLSFDILGQIAEALSESDLPYKVDIVDLATTEPAFRERIRSSCVPFEIGDPHPAR